MRFLFVYQDYAQQARSLLEQLHVRDVTIIVIRKNAVQPTDEEMVLLRRHPKAPAAACEVNRKYRKSIDPLVTLCCEPKKFRIDDQVLKEWLFPKDAAKPILKRPSAAFSEALQASASLVLHPQALAEADDAAELRWEFIRLSAEVLVRYANGEALGPMRNWKAEHGVDFAANGRVAFKFRVVCDGQVREGRTEWHLKEGDATTREGAARVYFTRVDLPSGPRVIVFHVGPHPEGVEHTVTVAIP